MGKFIKEDINRVLKGTTFASDKKEYAFVKYPKEAYSDILVILAKLGELNYSEIILDKKELTLIVEFDVWKRLFEHKVQYDTVEDPMAIITCDVVESTVTGYLLAITRALSTSDISVFVQGAFTTDHILVFYKDIDLALRLLNKLKIEGMNF
ncbi:MAG: ACT domain-containing protein [Patescibacteria group bacterium]